VTRLSGDELRDGDVWNGFDDALQVSVIDGVAQSCGHPVVMPRGGACRLALRLALRLAGRRIETIPGAQRRLPTADGEAGSSRTDRPRPRTEA
jgi:hypothetical protein